MLKSATFEDLADDALLEDDALLYTFADGSEVYAEVEDARWILSLIPHKTTTSPIAFEGPLIATWTHPRVPTTRCAAVAPGTTVLIRCAEDQVRLTLPNLPSEEPPSEQRAAADKLRMEKINDYR